MGNFLPEAIDWPKIYKTRHPIVSLCYSMSYYLLPITMVSSCFLLQWYTQELKWNLYGILAGQVLYGILLLRHCEQYRFWLVCTNLSLITVGLGYVCWYFSKGPMGSPFLLLFPTLVSMVGQAFDILYGENAEKKKDEEGKEIKEDKEDRETNNLADMRGPFGAWAEPRSRRAIEYYISSLVLILPWSCLATSLYPEKFGYASNNLNGARHTTQIHQITLTLIMLVSIPGTVTKKKALWMVRAQQVLLLLNISAGMLNFIWPHCVKMYTGPLKQEYEFAGLLRLLVSLPFALAVYASYLDFNIFWPEIPVPTPLPSDAEDEMPSEDDEADGERAESSTLLPQRSSASTGPRAPLQEAGGTDDQARRGSAVIDALEAPQP